MIQASAHFIDQTGTVVNRMDALSQLSGSHAFEETFLLDEFVIGS